MSDGRRQARSSGDGRSTASACFAALDLGTNNCRLLIAAPAGRGYRVVEAFSRIVRLGEGLSRTGRLDPTAMQRTLEALEVCAAKIARRGVSRVRAVATQACRAAENGDAFIAEAATRTGLSLEIISPQEEARLSVLGCLNLIEPRAASAALVLDVGGGSTELSWLDLRDRAFHAGRERLDAHRLPLCGWMSAPIGVVTLAERFPEASPATSAWFRIMVEHMKVEIGRFHHVDHLRPVFEAGQGCLIGTSGAITSLAGLHLGLRRYDRSRVDGLWMSHGQCVAAADRLMAQTPAERAAEPCIGADRADLVLAGAAILQAVQELWPCDRVRVADRGLREGILLSLVEATRHERQRIASDRVHAPAIATGVA